MKIIEADQNRPYSLMKNKFLHGKEYKELLCIVKKNHPNITAPEIIEMFKKLSNTGCSAAMVANIIGEKVYVDDSDFIEKFGFSLSVNNGKAIDYNKILVDLYSKLYNVAKVKLIKYDEYDFTDILEAAKVLLKKIILITQMHFLIYLMLAIVLMGIVKMERCHLKIGYQK